MTTGEEQSRSDCSVQKRPTDGRDRRRRTARRRVRGTVPQGLRGVLRRWGQRFGAEVSPLLGSCAGRSPWNRDGGIRRHPSRRRSSGGGPLCSRGPPSSHGLIVRKRSLQAFG